MKETQRVKPFNYDNVFIENNEYKKHNTLFQVIFKALSMEEKDVNLWWDVVQDIVQKDIGKICWRYERSERLYKHKIFQMEKVMPTFECEPLVLFPELETLDEEKDRGDTGGARPSTIRTPEEEPRDLRGGKENPNKEAIGKTPLHQNRS